MMKEKPSSENPKELVKALDSEMELIQDSNQNMSPVRKKQVDLDTKSEDEPIKLKVWFISRFLKLLDNLRIFPIPIP